MIETRPCLGDPQIGDPLCYVGHGRRVSRDGHTWMTVEVWTSASPYPPIGRALSARDAHGRVAIERPIGPTKGPIDP